jgi:hypothetical protein
LNLETGEISLNLDLNSKTGEKSPGWGVHAVTVTGASQVASSQISRLGRKAAGGSFPCGRPGRLASAAITWHSQAAERVAATIADSSGRVGAVCSISAVSCDQKTFCPYRLRYADWADLCGMSSCRMPWIRKRGTFSRTGSRTGRSWLDGLTRSCNCSGLGWVGHGLSMSASKRGR